MGRPSLYRAPEPKKSIIGASDLPQGDPELRLDRRVLESPCRALERGHSLGCPVLLQQGATEKMQRLRMLRNSGQHVAGETLAVLRPPKVDGGGRPLELRLRLASSLARPARSSPLDHG